MPAIWTRRVASSITTNTSYVTRPCQVATSTVKKSVAASTSQWSCRNCLPAHAHLAALRSGLQVVAAQDFPHRDGVDGMSQVCECPLDPSIAPGGILLRHLDPERFDRLKDTRSPERSAMLAPVKLLHNEAVLPAYERLGRGNRGDLFQALCDRVGEPARRGNGVRRR